MPHVDGAELEDVNIRIENWESSTGDDRLPPAGSIAMLQQSTTSKFFQIRIEIMNSRIGSRFRSS